MSDKPRIGIEEPKGLAAFSTIRWAIAFVFQNFGSFLKVSISPFILTVLITNAFKMMQLFNVVDLGAWGDPVLTVLLLAIVSAQATAWHRFALLPGHELTWFQFVFGGREIRFLAISVAVYAFAVLLGFAAAFLIAPIPAFSVAIQILAVVLLMWVMARCVMFLPAASIGKWRGIKVLLRYTKGIAGRVVGVYFVAGVLMTIFGFGFNALSEIGVWASVGLPSWIIVVAETLPRAFFNLLAVGVSISVLSSVYKQIIDAAEHQTGETS